ncbi:MAG: rod shape-determining protein MreC [Blastocatellia bacterium]
MIPTSLTIKARDKAKQSPNLLLVSLLAVHLVAISLNRVPGQPDVRYLHTVALTIAWPFLWITSNGTALIKDSWNRHIYLQDKMQENESLKIQIAKLEAQNIELGEKAKFLDQTNAINRLSALSSYEKVTARVIGRDSEPWFNTVVIDAGTVSGVSLNQPVVTSEGGLVGRVIQTSPVSSRVLLITDERHGGGAVIALTTGERAFGVIKGRNQSLCSMNFGDPPKKLENGEQVITSGQDQLYPRGLLIGRVANLSPGGAAPSSIDIEPAARLAHLETVAVLKIEPAEIRRQYDELVREEQLEKEREKQEKTPDRKKREAGR